MAGRRSFAGYSAQGASPPLRADNGALGLDAERDFLSLVVSGRGGPPTMKKNRRSKTQRRAPKTILRLPDLDQPKLLS
jgi:hypothetical protein